MDELTPYILLLNGPNLNRLGVRDVKTYGTVTLADITARVSAVAHGYGVQIRAFQSNHEGALIDFLQTHGLAARGIIINPGAFGHYSYALRDCLEDIQRPTIEVHISNVHRREAFRHQLVLASVVTGQIVGLGPKGYELAVHALCKTDDAPNEQSSS